MHRVAVVAIGVRRVVEEAGLRRVAVVVEEAGLRRAEAEAAGVRRAEAENGVDAVTFCAERMGQLSQWQLLREETR